jgi:precorrin-6Y C5,15-methyltransferase (decarboxylating)
MGGGAERRLDGTASGWRVDGIADFNTVAVECIAAPGVALLPRTPGLPDAAFAHDGQITKREVRAVTLAALAPVPGQLLWDVGAGSGAVAIEWMRAAPTCRAVAIERDARRVARIAENAARLGTPNLVVLEGEAPEALKTLESPDAVFIGGGLTATGMFEACWQALKPGGRLVANAVTLESEQALIRRQPDVGGELTRLAISRADDLGCHTGWRPFRPVTQLAAVKR